MATETVSNQDSKSDPVSQSPSDSETVSPDPGEPERDDVGENRSTNQAYLRGRESLRVDGNAASAHKSKVKNLIGGNYYSTKIFPDAGDRKASGLVRQKMLDRIRASFALVAGYDRMLDALRENRVIVLRGLPETGMTTTAVRLLDDVASSGVARLDLTSGITSIRKKDLIKGRGYVVRLTTPGPHNGLTEVELDALAEMLDKRKCKSWCVIVDTTGADQGGPTDYAFAYRPPDRGDILRKHIRWRLQSAEGSSGSVDRLIALAEDVRLVAALGEKPSLADLVRLAELLVKHERKQLDLDDVVAGCASLVADQMASWFAWLRHPQPTSTDSGNVSLALAAFRIALAALNISSYQQVVDVAKKLGKHMVDVIDPDAATWRLSSVSLDRHNALTMSRAHSWQGAVSYGDDVVVNGELVSYLDDRFPVAVLEHVWQEYHWLRDALVNWLIELGKDDSAIVWVRAAQTAGACPRSTSSTGTND
jgi:hypothetical protein